MVVLGILAGAGQAWYILLVALSLLFWWCIHQPKRWTGCVLALLLCAGFFAGAWRRSAADAAWEKQISCIADGQQVRVRGRVIKKQANENGWTVYLKDCRLQNASGRMPANGFLIYLKSDKGPVIGNTIFVAGKTAYFKEARNRGNYDERSMYRAMGYLCRVYADRFDTVVCTGFPLREHLYELQQRLFGVYRKHMPKEEAGVLSAMLLGDKSQLSEEQKQLYQRAGIAHILAISGLHISILGMACFRMLRRLMGRYVPSALLSMGLLLLFGMMTGMGMSTVRALLMFGVFLGAACTGRAYDMPTAVAVAAALLLLYCPAALNLAGVQFSFLAVLGVLAGKTLCRVFCPRWRVVETMLISGGIQLATLPLTAYYYFELPVLSLLCNLLILPLAEGILSFGLLGGALGLVTVLQVPSRLLLGGCTFALRYVSKVGSAFLKLPFSVAVVGRPKAAVLLCYYILLAGCIVFLSMREEKRWLSGARAAASKERAHIKDCMLAAFCMAGCLFLAFCPYRKHMQLSLLDVGQGDGIYLHTSDHQDVFVDGGSTDVKKVGTYRILPFLKSEGVAKVDYWFLSHLDKDHISGMTEILESGYPVHHVVLAEEIVKDDAYGRMMELLAAYQVKTLWLKAGGRLCSGQASFTCLWPDAGMEQDRNARSMVLLYQDGDFSAWLSGDISKEEEQRIMDHYALPPVTFYKAAHHGSSYSNGEEALAQLRPQIAAYSCAKKNDYGHPGEEALEHMARYSGCVYGTEDCGQLTVLRRRGRWECRRFLL